jgi:glucokinase
MLSGPGLMRLYRTLAGNGALTPEEIVTRAKEGDGAARAAVAMFVRLLGRFAGGLALSFKATGAVYLTGGVACALGPMLDAQVFRAAFEAHPPHAAWLRRMPSYVITDAEPGLVGCAVFAERMLREASAA